MNNLTGYNSRYLDKEEKKKYTEKKLRKQKWFTSDEYWEFSIRLVNKDGEDYNHYACWTGYFESLNFGEVVPHKDELPKFHR